MMTRRPKITTRLPGGQSSGGYSSLRLAPPYVFSYPPSFNRFAKSLLLVLCWLANPALTNSTAAATSINDNPAAAGPPTTLTTPPRTEFTASRIVAYATPPQASPQTFLQGLGQHELIDDNQQWQGAATHVVHLGNLFEEGSAAVSHLDTLIRLQAQARAAGGGIHVLLGSPQLRERIEGWDAPVISRTDNITPDSLHGRWLLSLPAIIKINRTLFTYGGLSPLVRQLGIEDTNANTQRALRSAMTGDPTGPLIPPHRELLKSSGALWYRGTAACHSLLETPTLAQALAALDADRVVITNPALPASQISRRLGDRVVVIGSGARQSSAEAVALELRGTNASVLRANLPTQNIAWAHPLLLAPPSAEMLLAPAIAAARLTPQDGSTQNDRVSVTVADGKTYQGRFVQATRREVNNALAAMRLDRWLGLHMVPVTVKHKLGRRRGYAQFTPGGWLTEATRAQQNLVRPSYCGNGHAYNLVSAFDALSGAQPRSSQSLAYDPLHWSVRITDSHKTFSTRTTLPNYPAKPVLSALLGQRLRTLDASQLAQITADLLTQEQRDALLARLTLVLAW